MTLIVIMIQYSYCACGCASVRACLFVLADVHKHLHDLTMKLSYDLYHYYYSI